MEQDKKYYNIVDSHLHYVDFFQNSDGFPKLIESMDEAGVSSAAIFGLGITKQWDATRDNPPTRYLGDDCRCYYYSGTDFIVAEELLAQPEHIRKRFFPFCCGINGNDRFSANHIRRLLKLYPNFWCGIGELMSRHDALTSLTYGEPPHINHPAFLEIFDLAAEEHLPVLIHHNISSEADGRPIYLDELKEALLHNKDCNIIWAHMGISRNIEIKNLTMIVSEMLKSHNNLYMDISWLVYDNYFLDKFADNFLDGNTLEDWVSLIEAYPDRIMIGSDKVGHWMSYSKEIKKYYTLLDKLNPDTVKKICSENFLRLVKR